MQTTICKRAACGLAILAFASLLSYYAVQSCSYIKALAFGTHIHQVLFSLNFTLNASAMYCGPTEYYVYIADMQGRNC